MKTWILFLSVLFSVSATAGPVFNMLLNQVLGPPENLTTPTIILSAFPSGEMTVNEGTWTGNPTFTYQWISNTVDIPGATSQTFNRGISTTNTWICRVTANGLVSVDSSEPLQPVFVRRYQLSSTADTGIDALALTNVGGIFTDGRWVATNATARLLVPRQGDRTNSPSDVWAGMSFAFDGAYITNRALSGFRDGSTMTYQFTWNRQGLIGDTNYGMAAFLLRSDLASAVTTDTPQWRTEAGAFDHTATNSFEWFIQRGNSNNPVRLLINGAEASLIRSNAVELSDTNTYPNPTQPTGVGAYNSDGSLAGHWASNSSLGGFEIRRPPEMFTLSSLVNVFTNGDGGIDTFRIPAMVINPITGTLHAFAEGRTNSEGDDGQKLIVHRRSTDDGATWGTLNTILNDGRKNFNPCAFFDSSNNLQVVWLNHSTNYTAAQMIAGTGYAAGERLRVYQNISSDDGVTWGIANTNLTAQWGAATNYWILIGPNAGARITNGPNAGRILVYGTTINSNTTPTRFDSIYYTDDDSQTWSVVNRSTATTTNQNGGEVQIATFSGTNLLTLRRMTTNRKQTTMSADGGLTWTDYTNMTVAFGPQIQSGLLITGTNIWHSYLSGTATTTIPDSRKNLILRHGNIDAVGNLDWKDWQVINRGPSGYSGMVQMSSNRIGMIFETGTVEYYDGISVQVLTPTNEPQPGS